MVVANKFQTGFDQPLLAGMFLDKVVTDRNAVQTVSRLNRCHEGKRNVVVVDFTNNAARIIKAFAKYREGTPYAPTEPDQAQCVRLYREILDAEVFTQDNARSFAVLVAEGNDAAIQAEVQRCACTFRLSWWSRRSAKPLSICWEGLSAASAS
jgi:type I restriction enzyme R subunit